MKKIQVQIHDYDRCGIYHIVEDREATSSEVAELKKRARASVHADWGRLPEEARHIVYYAELLDVRGEVWFAAVYMHGEAYCDSDFYRTFTAPDVGYVGAVHKRDLPPEFRR